MTFNFVSAAAIALVAASAADGAGTALHVNLGLWEMTSTAKISGAPPIPEGTLAQLPPAQRAKVMAAIQSSMAQAQRPRTVRSCLTQKDLDRPFHGMENHPGSKCSESVTSSSWTSQVIHMTCASEHGTTDGTVHIQAPTPNAVQGEVNMTISNQGHTMDTKVLISGHWLGANCGSVKPSNG